MILTSKEVQPSPSLLIPDQDEVIIVPLGDIQYGPPECDVDRLKRLIAWASQFDNVYFVGMGDYIDFASPSNRGRQKAMQATGESYDSTTRVQDKGAREDLEALKRLLAPTRGKWLALLSGHHYWVFEDGTNSDEELAEYLGAEYLGVEGIVNVKFPKADTKRGTQYFNIWMHHGEGNAQTLAGVLGKPEKMAAAYDEVDVFLMGHVHKKVTAKFPRVRPIFPVRGGEPKLQERNVIVATTGSFLKAKLVNVRDGRGRPKSTYVEKGMMKPATLGVVFIHARPRYDADGYASVDLDITA